MANRSGEELKNPQTQQSNGKKKYKKIRLLHLIPPFDEITPPIQSLLCCTGSKALLKLQKKACKALSIFATSHPRLWLAGAPQQKKSLRFVNQGWSQRAFSPHIGITLNLTFFHCNILAWPAPIFSRPSFRWFNWISA